MFISDFEDYSNKFEYIKIYNKDRKEKFPFLKEMKLLYKDNVNYIKWEYSKTYKDYYLTVDIYKDKTWSIEVEQIQKETDNENVIMFENNNIYRKYSMTYEIFLNEMRFLNKKFDI